MASEALAKEARMVELVDTQDLKSCGHCGRAGSTPAPGTQTPVNQQIFRGFVFLRDFDILNSSLRELKFTIYLYVLLAIFSYFTSSHEVE